jgi:hypothetical protein
MTGFLSDKSIPARERLIVALDMPNAAEARALVERLGDSAWFYKIGLELFMAGGYFELMEWLGARGKKVFVVLGSKRTQFLGITFGDVRRPAPMLSTGAPTASHDARRTSR